MTSRTGRKTRPLNKPKTIKAVKTKKKYLKVKENYENIYVMERSQSWSGMLDFIEECCKGVKSH